MTAWQSFLLGLVEGLTEYLPVSSTGHLLLAERALGIEESEASNAYAIAIQAGAIVAVLGLYHARVRQMGKGVIGADAEGRQLLINLVVAFVPAAIIGLLFDDLIESYLFGPWPVVFAWFVGGVLLMFFDRWRDARAATGMAIGSLTARSAVIIGLAQCIAMWPGTSRSLVTIVAGVAVGLSLPAAVEFAFLLGLITLGAATAYSGLKHGDALLATFGLGPIVVGFLSAWLSAIVAVQGMVAWLQSRGMAIFGVWRILLALVVGGLLASGRL